MPYSGPSDSTLPDYVKKLNAKDKRQWVAVFNSAYQSCQDEGGEDCESSAFAQANGVVKVGGRRMDITELWEKIRALFEPLIERIKDVASWDGSASRYGSTEAYCRACLINMNTGPSADWTQAKCKLPVKDTDGQPVRQAIHAAAAALAGARGGIDAPPDEKKKAANKIISYYNQMDEQAPDSVYKAAGKTPPKRSTAYLPTQTRALTITRAADGQARWLVIAASAVVNRVGAIDSTVLFDNFIRRASESGEYPALDFLHEGEQLRFGPADWLKRDGALYLASGTFDDTDIARAAQVGLEKDQDYWGASIAYHPMSEPLRLVAEGDIPVYTDGINNYISIVPKRMAANLFTAASVTEEVMRMDQRAYEELVKLVGEEAAKPFAAMVDEANRTITKTGMVVRADEPKAEIPPAMPAVPVVIAEAPKAEPAPVEERADEPWKSALDALTERVAQIEKALKDGDESKRSSEERAVKELDRIKSDLAGVMDSKSRWDQWLNDLPESIRAETESVYRARNQSPAPMTAEQLAAQNIAALHKGPRHSRQ